MASPPMTTADVGVTRFTSPFADWYAVTTSVVGTPAKWASGAMIGIDTVASPELEGSGTRAG